MSTRSPFASAVVALGAFVMLLTVPLRADDGRLVAAGGGQTLSLVFGFAATVKPDGTNPRGHMFVKNRVDGFTFDAIVDCVEIFTPGEGGVARISGVTTGDGSLPPDTPVALEVYDNNELPDLFGYGIDTVEGGTCGQGGFYETVLKGEIVIRNPGQ